MSNPTKDNPVVTEFNNKPTLLLNPTGKFPFSFGVAKARMIVDNFEAIKKFVETDGKSCQITDLQ